MRARLTRGRLHLRRLEAHKVRRRCPNGFDALGDGNGDVLFRDAADDFGWAPAPLTLTTTAMVASWRAVR
jgi:hypothetical protein